MTKSCAQRKQDYLDYLQWANGVVRRSQIPFWENPTALALADNLQGMANDILSHCGVMPLVREDPETGDAYVARWTTDAEEQVRMELPLF